MVRLANNLDLENVMNIIQDAKDLFKSKGSSQWQDTDGYPSLQTMKKDIDDKILFVCERNQEIVGCMALSPEHEICYDYIYDGKWDSKDNYIVLHRMATKKEYYHQGVAHEMLLWAKNYALNKEVEAIRVDTKEDNILMMSLLLNNNYLIKGKVKILRSGCIDPERIAFELYLGV